MSRRTIRTLAHSVAAEAQLLAEEKWIIEALNKIKTQRNCLQIERLQLESMKNQMTVFSIKVSAAENPPPKNKEPSIPLSRMQNTMEAQPAGLSTDDQFFETEALCNNEELNLNVTNSIFNKISTTELNMEEDEEDEEIDNCEDLLIDMNMFMNGCNLP